MPNFYCTSDDSDSEPVNLNLFSGKTFCFIGLSEKTEETIKKVVQVSKTIFKMRVPKGVL